MIGEYSRKKCPKGSMSRRSYISKSGKKVKATCIKSKSYRARGLPPRSGFMRSMSPFSKHRSGSLTKYGYKLHSPKSSRHEALRRAVKQYGVGATVKKLNFARVRTKYTYPQNSAIDASDVSDVQSFKK